jgi:DNA-binding CsgD family transcriptional regulator
LIAWADQTYEGVRVVSTEARVIRPFVLVRATYRSEVRDEPERIAHSYSLFGVVGGLIVRIRAFARESDAARAATAGVLTPRQCEILQLLSGGLNAPDVAERLVLSPTTVRTHVRDAMVRLGARNRVEAVALALRTGEIEM